MVHSYFVSCSFSRWHCCRWLCRLSLSCWRPSIAVWLECSNWACSLDTFSNRASIEPQKYRQMKAQSWSTKFTSLTHTFFIACTLELFSEGRDLCSALSKLCLCICQLKRIGKGRYQPVTTLYQLYSPLMCSLPVVASWRPWEQRGQSLPGLVPMSSAGVCSSVGLPHLWPLLAPPLGQGQMLWVWLER